MTGYRLTLDAKSDLVQIRTYTLKQWGKAQSQKYFAQLRKTIRMLSDNHALGKRQQDVGLNVLSFPYSSHVIEELVARLCEAELATRNGKFRDVMWSGSIKAPDGGVDVRVTISSGEFDGDFVPRLDTVFQAKAKSMQPAEIRDEMLENGTPSPIVTELVEAGGAYILEELT